MRHRWVYYSNTWGIYRACRLLRLSSSLGQQNPSTYNPASTVNHTFLANHMAAIFVSKSRGLGLSPYIGNHTSDELYRLGCWGSLSMFGLLTQVCRTLCYLDVIWQPYGPFGTSCSLGRGGIGTMPQICSQRARYRLCTRGTSPEQSVTDAHVRDLVCRFDEHASNPT
jgi:hypothetical protein